MYILYWDELSKQVEVIKDTCWIECLELTMSEAHMGRGAVQRGLVFSSERDSDYELSYMQ